MDARDLEKEGYAKNYDNFHCYISHPVPPDRRRAGPSVLSNPSQATSFLFPAPL